MSYRIFITKAFKKDFKKLKKSEKELLKTVLNCLTENKKLDRKYKDHKLLGNFKGCRECHLKSDLLLIYRVNKEESLIELVRIGSHSDLFS
jgi:mRNA interferase YafQ